MRRYMKLLTLAGCVTALPFALHAQQPGGPGGPGRMGAPMMGAPTHGADWFLAHTGELQLTDAQVTRLAAIARRTETRRRALRATMDSAMMARRTAPDDAARRTPPDAQAMAAMQQRMQQQRDQDRTDLRDALATLTADQQATAWMMVSGPGRVGDLRAMGGGAPRRMGRPGGEGRRGGNDRRGPDGPTETRPPA